MSWFMRKLIASVTITLYVKHYKDDDGVEHIDVEQIGTGGFKGNFEPRQIDGQVRPSQITCRMRGRPILQCWSIRQEKGMMLYLDLSVSKPTDY